MESGKDGKEGKEEKEDPNCFAPKATTVKLKELYGKAGKDKDEFHAWIKELHQSEPGRIQTEFEALSNQLKDFKPLTTDVWKKNANFNRYNDMVCFDQTRVILQDGLDVDYIHANWLNGFQRLRAYILTQGPLDNTITDFWRMIWQEGIATIVMVTRLEEKGRPKCATYFSTSSDADFQAGFFRISLKRLEKRKLCIAGLYDVKNLLTDEVRSVIHVWYVMWPDQGVPEDIESLRHFLNYVKTINLKLSLDHYNHAGQHKRGPPVVYHCSAGIGRSAALIALDYLTESITHGCHTDLLQLVKQMRKERYHAIHTKIQLLFIYDYVVSLASHDRHHLLAKSTASPSLL